MSEVIQDKETFLSEYGVRCVAYVALMENKDHTMFVVPRIERRTRRNKFPNCTVELLWQGEPIPVDLATNEGLESMHKELRKAARKHEAHIEQ